MLDSRNLELLLSERVPQELHFSPLHKEPSLDHSVATEAKYKTCQLIYDRCTIQVNDENKP